MLISTSRTAVVAALCALTVPAAACAARAGRAQAPPAAPTPPAAPATSSADYARPVSSPPDACPAMPYRTVLRASKAIEKDGGRVLVNVYLSPQDEGLDPVAAGGTRGSSGGSRPGSYKVLAAAFRPGDVLYSYGDEKTYRAERDPATGIKVICKLELSATNQRIVLDAACDEEDPPACTGRTTHVVSRTSYEFDGQALGERTQILEKKVSQLCD